MDADKGILPQIRQAAALKILFLPHAVQQMSRPERLISAAESDTWSTQERSSKIIQKTHGDTVVCYLVTGQTTGLCMSYAPQKPSI
jgi:hypothetical protein